MDNQQQYDNWSENISIETIEKFNWKPLNEVEIQFLEFCKPKHLLDIGCGSGIKLFNHLQNKNIDFYGIEKFNRFYETSIYKNKIIQFDICSELSSLLNFNFDTVTILGGTFYGILKIENHYKAWNNVNKLLINNGNVIYEQLIFDFFEKNYIGEVKKLHMELPPQYFNSFAELKNIWKLNNLIISNFKDYNISKYFKSRYFLLKKISDDNI